MKKKKKVQSLPKGFEIVSSVCQYVCIMYVPALCTHRYEYSSKAFECYHYCQKHSKIPNFNFESNIENIFTIPQQSEANSFGRSMASNNWKACVSNILNHQKRFSILQTCPSKSVKPNFPFTLEERWICNDKESLHRMKRKNSPFCVFLLLSTFLGTFLVIFSFRHSQPSLWVPGCVIMIK